jgi:hypothetical protein
MIKKEKTCRVLKRYREICLNRAFRYYDADSMRGTRRHGYWCGKAEVAMLLLNRAGK